MALDQKHYFRQYRERNREKLRAYFKDYYAKNKEVIKSRSRVTWRKLNKEAYQTKRKERESAWEPERKEKKKMTVRERAYMKVLRKHSLTMEQYEQMAVSQGYACAICHQVPDHRLFIDHNHSTSQVRGLLCRSCNTAIGLLKDNAQFLASAITYLTK